MKFYTYEKGGGECFSHIEGGGGAKGFHSFKGGARKV